MKSKSIQKLVCSNTKRKIQSQMHVLPLYQLLFYYFYLQDAETLYDM